MSLFDRQIMVRGPVFIERLLKNIRSLWLIDLAGAAAPWAIGVATWTAIGPYFLWGHLFLLYGAELAVLACLALVASGNHRWPTVLDLVGGAMLAAFLIYISTVHRYDGTATRWFFVLPTLAALWLMVDSARALALWVFGTVFAVTLVPGILVSLWTAVGLPIIFDAMPYYQPQMAAAGSEYLVLPGALFVKGTSIALPWGGVLARLCAVYDEPGMVGTVAALLLASDRFRLNRWQNIVFLLGGILSFSLAFEILAALGFAIRVAIVALRPSKTTAVYAIALAAVIFATLLSLGRVNLAPSAPVTISVEEPNGTIVATPLDNTEIRQTAFVNNRDLPPMEELMHRYWRSDANTLLFGIAADATEKAAPMSQVFWRIFPDFGAIGFALLAGGFGFTALAALRVSDSRLWLLLFLLCFALSFYQRPIIWLPYPLMLFFGGMAATSRQ